MSRTSQPQNQATAAIMGLQPAVLEKQLQAEDTRRKVVQKFIQQNLTEGIDYGRIHVVTRDKCAKPWDCKIDSHFSKPCLFKPGAEKFCSLLQLRAEFIADKDTLEMIGTAATGLVAFRCLLSRVNQGDVISEGRGACSIAEKGGLVNTTVKIAEKRAQVDAVLRLGLSDSFTQDLEDVKELSSVVADNQSQTQAVSPKQLDDIRMFAFVKSADLKSIRAYTLKEFGSQLEKITPEQADQVLAMLEKKYGAISAIS
jgi:hypothetical protein